VSAGDRYSRQIRFAGLGREGQRRLERARIGVAGLGALGGVACEQLVRAGVGYVRLIDRDLVELSNLQRQSLYDEEDARINLPKAVAAERRLSRINSSVELDARVDDLNPGNVEAWISDLDLVVDGLDNFETRFVLNDAARKLNRPWIYGAAVGSYGLVFPVVPGQPCLRCIVGSLPAPGNSPTCETEGVIAPITGVVGSLEAALALRILSGRYRAEEESRLASMDVWNGTFQSVTMPASLCGRNAVQLIPGVPSELDLERLSESLEAFGRVESNEFLLKCLNPPYELTVFRDGRAIVKGTEEPAVARSLYSKMVGA
jgi:molybdopterin/thiamine biosynthesis adenylyltransferase